VLRKALATASVCGLDGVTLGQVAGAAKVSKGHLALLFGNRENLQLATLRAAADVFRTHVVAHAETGATAAERLRRLCEGWFDYVADRVLPGGCLVTATSSEFRAMKGAVRDEIIALRRRGRERLCTAVQAAVEESGVRGIVVDEVVLDIQAYQAAANTASLLGDVAAFAHARKATRRLLATLTVRQV
jgi:AcrR family transcriptional regulator